MVETAVRGRSSRSGAFTLIELLVVIAIIAILISVLVPALSAARKHAQVAKCGTNLHHVGQAMMGYLADSTGTYPPAYIYPYDASGNYDLNRQDEVADHPFGYLHWTHYLYNNGTVDGKAFECPTFPNGGTPRTNPGPDGGNWESGQVDQFGQSGSGTLTDKQAARVAYGGNAAIFPRNKFTPAMSGGPRVNRCVNDKEINTGKTILVAEFNKNWKATALDEGGGMISKSHRPINPFYHISTGSNEYADTNPGFTYGNVPTFGLMTGALAETATNLIDNAGTIETNAVGRHHPGGGDHTGGTANFLYADGHVDRKTILQTVKDWDWGTKYYSVTGANKVGPPW